MKKGTESVLFLVCVIICVGSSISVNKQTSFMHFNRLKNNLFFLLWCVIHTCTISTREIIVHTLCAHRRKRQKEKECEA